jgi:hypothetical protein
VNGLLRPNLRLSYHILKRSVDTEQLFKSSCATSRFTAEKRNSKHEVPISHGREDVQAVAGILSDAIDHTKLAVCCLMFVLRLSGAECLILSFSFSAGKEKEGEGGEGLSEEQGVRSTQASWCAKLSQDIDACPWTSDQRKMDHREKANSLMGEKLVMYIMDPRKNMEV